MTQLTPSGMISFNLNNYGDETPWDGITNFIVNFDQGYAPQEIPMSPTSARGICDHWSKK